MATHNKSKSGNNNGGKSGASSTYKGKNLTPVGILPPEQAIRHKLVNNNVPTDPSYRKTYYTNRKAKKLFELTKGYRQYVHKVYENRLSQSMRDTVHYLIEPMARGGGDGNNNDSVVAETNSSTTSS